VKDIVMAARLILPLDCSCTEIFLKLISGMIGYSSGFLQPVKSRKKKRGITKTLNGMLNFLSNLQNIVLF
jgi:hypothetical protein